MVFICWFMFLDYVFPIKCFDLFFPFRNFSFLAYNQKSAWVHHYKILGGGTRCYPRLHYKENLWRVSFTNI